MSDWQTFSVKSMEQFFIDNVSLEKDLSWCIIGGVVEDKDSLPNIKDY